MTGNVDEMLNKMCEFYEEDGAVRARQAAIILGAVVLVLTGAYVLYVALKFYQGYGAQYQGF
jgi:type II secretory pathway component PulF